MLSQGFSVIATFRLSVAARRDLLMEIAALRHPLEVLRRSGAKPRIRRADRMFWIWLYRTWPKWRDALVIVQPETLLRWHRAGYRHDWRWKTRGKVGRSRLPRVHIEFIRRISRENPDWGEDKIALEMKLKLGVEHSASTIRRYRVDDGPLRGSTWRTFLGNHSAQILAVDFTTVVMWDDSVCYVLVVLEHRPRRMVSMSVTRNPTLSWLKQQIRDACPWDDVRFLLHDNDGIYGPYGKGKGPRCALDAWLGEVMGIRGIPIPYGAPNANAHGERVIGTLRREVLNHFIFRSESHFRRTLSEYREYDNDARPHQGIGAIPAERDSPRDVSRQLGGRLVGEPVLCGLHHDDRLAA